MHLICSDNLELPAIMTFIDEHDDIMQTIAEAKLVALQFTKHGYKFFRIMSDAHKEILCFRTELSEPVIIPCQD